MLDLNEVDSLLDVDENGAPIAYDLQFQDDVTVAHTYLLQNTEDEDVHLYIDVDEDNTPIAVSLVHPPSHVEYQRLPKSEPLFKHHVAKAYEFAVITANWAKAVKDSKVSIDMRHLGQGRDIVRDTERQLRTLEQLVAV